MKTYPIKSLVCATGFLLAGFATTSFVSATPIGVMNYNDPTPAYFGAGNPAGSWTSATVVRPGDLLTGDNTVALRFKNRSTGALTNDGAGTYNFATGTDVNVEFSASASNFQNISYLLSLDIDPSVGTNLVSFDPKLVYADNSLTPFSITGMIMQNSQRDIWYGFHAPGTYDMSFSAYLTSDTLHVNPLARTEARLVVGKGASRVPDSGTTGALFSATLFGLLGISRKFRK